MSQRLNALLEYILPLLLNGPAETCSHGHVGFGSYRFLLPSQRAQNPGAQPPMIQPRTMGASLIPNGSKYLYST